MAMGTVVMTVVSTGLRSRMAGAASVPLDMSLLFGWTLFCEDSIVLAGASG